MRAGHTGLPAAGAFGTLLRITDADIGMAAAMTAYYTSVNDDPRVTALNDATTWLKAKLDFEFSDATLLRRALTHRSAQGENNERLEFLGDAILDAAVSEVVFELRPDADEGALSRLRSWLVRDATLAEIASELGIGKQLILGEGERKSGGHRRASILADALEAIIGAVYLDAGYAEAQRIVHNAYGERLKQLPQASDLRDPKTRLQELLQSRKIPLPEYDVIDITGKAHAQRFTVSCSIDELDFVTRGEGSSRRDAEQQAAELMLEKVD